MRLIELSHQIQNPLRHLRAAKFVRLPLALAVACGTLTGTAIGANLYSVSQKDQAFSPGEIAIQRGATLRFINDDGELLHHAYLSADSFSFDSGDQQPGSSFDVVFSVSGDFTVLCGIHPKMKLAVHVGR